jgi:hypothetical protein
MIIRAQIEVLESTRWLTAVQVMALANFSTVGPIEQLSRWKQEARIFSIKPAGSAELFPAYGFDAPNGFRPIKELAEVITILAARKDGWGLAYWFASVNGFLGGRLPQEVLAVLPGEVVAAAKDETLGTTHG